MPLVGEQRGKKSAAAREIALLSSPTDIIPRPQPPEELAAEERAEWIAICNAVPADYFPPAMHMLLCSYCRHVVIARYLAGEIERCRRGRGDRKERLAELRGLAREHRAETMAIQVCLRSMRLTHQSVHAGDKAPVVISAMPKPWE